MTNDATRRMGMARLRIDLTNLLNDVDQNSEMLIITDRGKDVGALIPMTLVKKVIEIGGPAKATDLLNARQEEAGTSTSR